VEITVSSRNMELTDALKETALEKVGRLERFLSGMERAEIHFLEERNPRIADKDVCEVTMEGHGHHVRAKVAASDPYAAVDAAVAKLEQQLTKLKRKVVSRKQRRAGAPPVDQVLADLPNLVDTGADEGAMDDGDELVGDSGYRIVKTKRFAMKPMTPEEAVLQMDLLGHSFYFFANAETGRTAVVYHRGAGDVGLIDEAD
jgi:putative sigma-54 modulation protein